MSAQLGLVGVDGLVLETHTAGKGTHEVSFLVAGHRYTARLQLVVDELARLTTCRSVDPWRLERYGLVELRCEEASTPGVNLQ